MSIQFSDFSLSQTIQDTLARKGFLEPTPIQAMAIPELLENRQNILAKAMTGTGKTAAFGLPLVQLLTEPAKLPRALVLVPTRELALQVAREISSFSSGKYPRLTTIYGGAPMGEQLRALSRGVDIVVGTPGRILDHLDRGTLDLSALEWLVLDEADEMLDMGFVEDIERVINAAHPERRIVLFSATMPWAIMEIARKYLGDFELLEDRTHPVEAGLTEQFWIELRERDKVEALCRIVDSVDDFYGLVFCHTKLDTDSLARAISERGYNAEALHGDVSQDMRERTLHRFREKKTAILVATDVAARGIDVALLSHVINFSLPWDLESYTHRIGRTGRAGNKGTAITFVTKDEQRRLHALRRASGDGLKKGRVPELSEVIEAKRMRIMAKVLEKSTHENRDPVLYSLADELLAAMSPRDAIAAIANAGWGRELDPSAYAEIKEVSLVERDKARIFIGIGRKNGANPRDIARMVKKLTGLADNRIDEIEVLERFSFASLPFDAAERAVKEAARMEGGPHIRIAQPKKNLAAGGTEGKKKRKTRQKHSSGYNRSKKSVKAHQY